MNEKKLIEKDKITVVAEIAQSYEGNIDVLLETCKRLCLAGVEWIMFQAIYADELAVPSNRNYKLFQKLELSEENWKFVIGEIHKDGGRAIGEVFGEKSINVLLNAGIDALKIHTADLSNLPLLRYVGGLKKSIMLGVGGSFENEIETAIAALRKTGSPEIVLMHGYQLCPTSIADSNLLKIDCLSQRYNLPVGYSDHIAGSSEGDVSKPNPLANILPVVAMGVGAKLVEKHAMLDRSKAWEDYESALTPEEFREFIEILNEMYTALGNNKLDCNEAERIYRGTAKKSLVASRDISEGTRLGENDLWFRRIADPSEGIVNSKEVIGKKIKKALSLNDVIKRDNLI